MYPELMASKEESTVQVTMARDDKKVFDRLAKELGMTQKAAFGQLITWFQAQEPMIRSLVMGHIPEEYAGDIIELMYRRRLETQGDAARAREVVARAKARTEAQRQDSRGTRRKAVGESR